MLSSHSRSSSPTYDDQRYDLSKRMQKKNQPALPLLQLSQKISDTLLDDALAKKLNDHSDMTTVVEIDLRHSASAPTLGKASLPQNSPYRSEEVYASSSIILNNAASSNNYSTVNSKQYTRNNSTVLVIRPQKSYFNLDGILLSGSNSNNALKTVPRLSHDNLKAVSEALRCGLCTKGSSAFEKQVDFWHSQLEQEIKGEPRPIEIHFKETRNAVVREKWRTQVHDTVYSQFMAEQKEVFGGVEVC